MPHQHLFLELMSELTKKNVQSKKITQLCQQLKIPFTGDVVELMTFVLGSGAINKNLKVTANSNLKAKKSHHDVDI